MLNQKQLSDAERERSRYLQTFREAGKPAPTHLPCLWCEGRGHHQVGDDMKRCQPCNGTGKMEYR